LEQLQRREHEMRRPVRPWPLEADGDPPVAQPAEAALADRRAAEILAEALEPLAIARLDANGGVEVEAAVVGVERDVALDPRRIRVGSDPHGPPARARAEGGPPEDRRLGKPRHAADSSASGSRSSSRRVVPARPRRSSRRRIRPTTRRTSSSVGGAAGWKRSVPSGSRTNTPSTTSV